MRIRLFLLLVLAALPAGAAHVLFVHESPNASPQASRALTLYSLTAPYTNGAGAIVTRDWISRTLGTNGQVTVSNLYTGPDRPYMEVLQGSTRPTTNFYVFPLTNGLINASDYLTNSGVVVTFGSAYSQAQADDRFMLRSNGISRLSGFGTNLSIAINSPTNIPLGVLAQTNITVTFPIDAQKFILVTNATEPHIQGWFGIYATNGTVRQWTNEEGDFRLVFDSSGSDVSGCGQSVSVAITNGSGCYYGGTCITNGCGLDPLDFGDSPITIVQTNRTTNFTYFASLTVKGQTLLTNKDIYVDPILGSDVFTNRGPATPWRTIGAAVVVARSNDTIRLAAGDFPPEGFAVPAGVNLIGAGQGVTRIGYGGPKTTSFSAGGYCHLKDFGYYGVFGGTGQSNLLENLTVDGNVDAWFADLQNGWRNRAVNCYFHSYYDTFNCSGGSSQMAYIDFENCKFYVEFKAGVSDISNIGRGLSVLNNNLTIRMYGGSITVENFNGPFNGTGGACISIGAPGCRVELAGTMLRYPTTNSAITPVSYGSSTGTNVFTYGRLFNTNDCYHGTVTEIGPTNSTFLTIGFLPTNSIATWPTAPLTRGGAALINSNGTVYGLKSAPNGAAWISTNLIW